MLIFDNKKILLTLKFSLWNVIVLSADLCFIFGIKFVFDNALFARCFFFAK